MHPNDPRHGTYAGAVQHKKQDTPPCDACKAAAANYQRQRRANAPAARAADRWWVHTRDLALERLAREYPARFREILTEIREQEQAG